MQDIRQLPVGVPHRSSDVPVLAVIARQRVRNKWAFFTEHVAEGWMVTHPPKKSIDNASQAVQCAGADGTDLFNPNSECVCHNHAFIKNNVEKIMFPGMGEISEELDTMAKHLELT